MMDTAPYTLNRNSPRQQRSQWVAGQFNDENYSGR